MSETRWVSWVGNKGPTTTIHALYDQLGITLCGLTPNGPTMRSTADDDKPLCRACLKWAKKGGRRIR